jgi:hypothetical protein
MIRKQGQRCAPTHDGSRTERITSQQFEEFFDGQLGLTEDAT